MIRRRTGLVGAAILTIALIAGGCANEGGQAQEGDRSLKGAVDVDGSSTVEPISSAVAEEFMKAYPSARVTVAASGTGGGFKKFCKGEIDVAGASRQIEDQEIAACKQNGIEWIEIPVAYDGLSVVVNPQNDFVTDLTVEDLKKVWQDASVKTWSQVRAGWPNEPIKLYGPGTDSGTFDYFTKAVVGEEKKSRSDYQPSEDDNTLVQGVAGDKYALGYFGYAYYEQNKDKLKLVSVNGVMPSSETVMNGTYKPLSRPLFIYVNLKSLEKPAVAAFVKYYLENGKDLVPSVGYVPLNDNVYAKALENLNAKKAGPFGPLSGR